MINAQEKEIELILTYKCNWNCDYCCVDTHNRNSLSLDDIVEKLEKVIPGYNVTLSGGEPGTLPYNIIAMVIDKLEQKECKISLNTNGRFLKKYPELAHHFEYVLYHCSEDLIQQPDYFAVSDFKTKVEYMLVVSDTNYKNLDKFMNNNSGTTFHVVAATKADGGLGNELSSKNRYAIMAKKYANISPESLQRLIVKEKDFSGIIYI